MANKISEGEVKAAAQTAIAARSTATTAKAKATEAANVDPELNQAAADAEAAAIDAESKAADLSQKFTSQQKDIGKMKAKRADIEKTLRELGEEDDFEVDDDDEGEIDPDKPLTLRDLQRIDAGKAHKTAKELAAAVADPEERKAIQDALANSINPALIASNPQQAFEQARAIANGTRNAKIIEEANRRGKTQGRPTGSGAPPKVDDTFEPTAEEARYMRPPFNMTKEEIAAART